MSKIKVAVTVDLAEGNEIDPHGTVIDALTRVAEGVSRGETAGIERTHQWEITELDGAAVLSLDDTLSAYLIVFDEIARETK
jgi:hypothetical protein